MTPVIDVDPVSYEAASRVFGVDMAEGIDHAWDRLTGVLNATGGMAGSDHVGETWADHYDPAVAQVTAVIADLSRACVQIAALLERSGLNHGLAESASDPSRTVLTPADHRRYVVDDNRGAACIPGHDTPSAADGSPSSPPPGWHYLTLAVGCIWPSGDPGTLRDAANGWSAAAGALDSVSACVPDAVDMIELQRSPEIDDAATVCLAMQTHLQDTAAACRALARCCTALAGHVEHAHTQIEDAAGDLLVSIIEWEAAGAVFSVVTGGASEILANTGLAARALSIGEKVEGFITTLTAAARTVAETVADALTDIARVAARLKAILGAKLGDAAVALVERLPYAERVTPESRAAGVWRREADSFISDLRQGTTKLPHSWGRGRANRDVVGRRWFDPKDNGTGVRIDQGTPDSHWSSQRVDHVIVRYRGRVIGRDGRPITGAIRGNPDAHIPLEEWLRWTTWNHP